MSISSAGADVSGGSHLLQVHGYSIARYCAPDGMSIKSNPFTVGRRRWELSVFPNGDLSAESDGFISVSLTFLGDAAATDPDAEASPVKLRAEFSFAETSKQGQEHVWTRQTVGLPGTGFGVGYPRFVQREALEASNHLDKDGDCFTVRCDLLVIDEIEPEEMIDDENGTRYRQPNVLRCVACKSRPATIGQSQNEFQVSKII
ncbi:uncharacterized protein LOC104581940 [Brachypodium distachyon]|uniref:uncharacterized protein LOC104581940 n=1 Tax=Brachypodium distachyon TaxID=15368 RepID=UPI00052FF1CB|nr:uncharacterized protein LOC104581940 [Brachypodium distachyon]|eukprot:XP_010229431.1 uncharacterized protein LOC104581940 [Brachypodium distachyon]